MLKLKEMKTHLGREKASTHKKQNLFVSVFLPVVLISYLVFLSELVSVQIFKKATEDLRSYLL